MIKFSSYKEKLENYRKKLNASKKTDYSCWLLKKSKKYLKSKLKSSNRS